MLSRQKFQLSSYEVWGHTVTTNILTSHKYALRQAVESIHALRFLHCQWHTVHFLEPMINRVPGTRSSSLCILPRLLRWSSRLGRSGCVVIYTVVRRRWAALIPGCARHMLEEREPTWYGPGVGRDIQLEEDSHYNLLPVCISQGWVLLHAQTTTLTEISDGLRWIVARGDAAMK